MCLTDSTQRGVAQSRLYCVRPTQSKDGNSFELVNDRTTVNPSPTTNSPIATKDIGSVPTIAGKRLSSDRRRACALALPVVASPPSIAALAMEPLVPGAAANQPK